MTAELLSQSLDEVAVQAHVIERTAKPAVTGNASFEARFAARDRNPHLGWNPDPQTIRGFQLLDAVLDGQFRGLFSSGRFVRGTGYLVPDDVMETIEVDPARLIHSGGTETVIVGCNVAHSNYFHWVSQALPAIDHAINRIGQSPRIRLALPKLNSWQEESLRLLGVSSVKRFTVEDPRKQYAFARVEFSQIINGAAAFSNSATARETYRRLREAVEWSSSTGKKLYVARTDAPTRVMRNEQGLIEEVSRRGYEVVVPGSLSFAEQVQLFRGARIVVGPHGAGMTNIVFCEPGTIVYELVPSHYMNACFCNLAHTCNLRFWQEAFESEGDGLPNLRHWESDTAVVLRRLDEIERIDTELQEEASHQTISAMDFLRGRPGQIATIEREGTAAEPTPAKVGWARKLLQSIFRWGR